MYGNSAATRGIVFALCGMAFLSIMDGLAKWLVLNSIHPIELLAIRSLLIVPALLLFYTAKGKSRELLPKRPVAQLIRGTTGFIAPLTFFLALQYLPLSSAVVVFFSSIFMTTVLSVIILGERVGLHRWLAVGVGYIGVFIAMSPGFTADASSDEMTGYILVLISSLFYAGLFISGKLLTRTDSVASLVLSYNACVGVIAAVMLPWFWRTPTLAEWGLLIALSIAAVAGHFCVTHAFALTDASAIAPLEYTTLLWAILIDVLIWGEVASLTTWLGALVIIASGLYVLHRERLREQTMTLVDTLPDSAQPGCDRE